MQFKGIESLNVEYTKAGKICIEQLDQLTNEIVFVYLTLDQFKVIEKWVDTNYLEILEAWNDGVEDEAEA